ncbi:hypothetical protein PQU92_15650 [Asticcacaulis sp. BYS171W]|uniref:DUF2393 domain-containing protein n=1 Tax=Asticcacaulis aquaticus TaxID=2984212 RepID=A0ABT5HXB3_9CAUL|nr:hypothetical protein [Asticcacaulis aquaticus]MDC7684719.1 hypothetical protein [Asticcacaulis aquaticus]
MTFYGFLVGTLAVVAVIAFIGTLFRLPFFGNRRRYGLIVLVIVIAIGSSLDGLKSEKDIAEDKEIDQIRSGMKEEKDAKKDLTTDALINFDARTVEGTITNPSPYGFKNVKLKCKAFAPSGKKVETVKVEVMRSVPANGKLSFSDVPIMEFIDRQATSSYCEVTGAERSYGAEAAPAETK